MGLRGSNTDEGEEEQTESFLSSFPFFQRCKCHPARGSARNGAEVRRSAIFQPAIGSSDDFERPWVATGVIKFRIFFKFLRFRSHDLARRRPCRPVLVDGFAFTRTSRKKDNEPRGAEKTRGKTVTAILRKPLGKTEHSTVIVDFNETQTFLKIIYPRKIVSTKSLALINLRTFRGFVYNDKHNKTVPDTVDYN